MRLSNHLDLKRGLSIYEASSGYKLFAKVSTVFIIRCQQINVMSTCRKHYIHSRQPQNSTNTQILTSQNTRRLNKCAFAFCKHSNSFDIN